MIKNIFLSAAMFGAASIGVAIAQTPVAPGTAATPPVAGTFNGGTMTTGSVPAGSGSKLVPQGSASTGGNDTPTTSKSGAIPINKPTSGGSPVSGQSSSQ